MWATEPAAAGSPSVHFFGRSGSIAPFSPAVQVGDVIYLSGEIGAAENGSIPADMTGQATLAMDHLGTALKMAGTGFDDVFRCTVMMTDMQRWAEFNRVYVSYFKPGQLPARSAFGVTGLAFGAGLEVECMAYMPHKESAK